MQIPKRRGEWRKKIGPADEYLTPEAIDGLKKELERLQKHAQPKAIAELQRTREMGDLSENAAYTEAKGRVLRLESVIFGIKERLKRAKTIQLGGTGEIVTVGSTVVVVSSAIRAAPCGHLLSS